MKFNLEKIIDKRVHCDTEEKANKLLKFLHQNGFIWNGGEDLTSKNNWREEKHNTFYEIYKDKTICFGNVKNEPGVIIEFEDVFESEGGNQMYYNLAFVNHGDSSNNYLFKLPMNIQVKESEKVYVDTVQGQAIGTCVK